MKKQKFVGQKKRRPHWSPFLFATLAGFNYRKRSVALLKQAGETLHLDHFFSLWSLGALGHLELDFLTFFQSLETVALDGAVVNEDV